MIPNPDHESEAVIRVIRAIEKYDGVTIETMRARYGEDESTQYAVRLLKEAQRFAAMHDALVRDPDIEEVEP